MDRGSLLPARTLPLPDPRTQRMAVFDLDRTLLPGSSLVALGRALLAAGVLPRRTLAAAAVRDLAYRRRGSTDRQVARVRDQALAAIAGVRRDDLLAVAERVVPDLVGSVTPGARSLVERHQQAGDFCVVLSASPQELVELVAAGLGIPRGIGTRGHVVDGVLTGRLDGPFCYGAGKLARLSVALGEVDLARAWAYADSASDLPVLRSAGHPVAVNPDRALAREAQRRRWPVLHLA
ncbi:MAG TPA: HAD-IB family hydrolase [Acidimicrobiales bacterium]|nr:HAD-IB family hydrolase [Acidimicrobiales bacterium]